MRFVFFTPPKLIGYLSTLTTQHSSAIRACIRMHTCECNSCSSQWRTCWGQPPAGQRNHFYENLRTTTCAGSMILHPDHWTKKLLLYYVYIALIHMSSTVQAAKYGFPIIFIIV